MSRSLPSKTVGPAVLRAWPLPLPSEGDKNDRGCLLVAAGALQMPGAAVLAAVSALRAGAGKLQIATDESIATQVGTAVPEALVMGFGEALSYAEQADALVVGPGMLSEDTCGELVAQFVVQTEKPVVLDALALTALATRVTDFKGRAVPPLLTPHAGEMAALLSMRKETIESDPAHYARAAARKFGAVVVLKGAQTYIAAPSGDLYCNRAGTIGLATSGSGDTLAGIAGGLLARGLDPLAAACWSVHAHARAGDALMKKMGVGFLARELPEQIPRVLRDLSARRRPNR